MDRTSTVPRRGDGPMPLRRSPSRGLFSGTGYKNRMKDRSKAAGGLFRLSCADRPHDRCIRVLT